MLTPPKGASIDDVLDVCDQLNVPMELMTFTERVADYGENVENWREVFLPDFVYKKTGDKPSFPPADDDDQPLDRKYQPRKEFLRY